MSSDFFKRSVRIDQTCHLCENEKLILFSTHQLRYYEVTILQSQMNKSQKPNLLPCPNLLAQSEKPDWFIFVMPSGIVIAKRLLMYQFQLNADIDHL